MPWFFTHILWFKHIHQNFVLLLLSIPSLVFWKSNLTTVLERKAKIQLSPWPPSPQESDNCLWNLRWQQQHMRPTIERDSSANGTCQLQTTTLVASSNQDKKLTNFDDSCFFSLLHIMITSLVNHVRKTKDKILIMPCSKVILSRQKKSNSS